MLALCVFMLLRLWKQKITALNCSKHLGKTVLHIQRKSPWLLKGFQRVCMETGWKRGGNPNSVKSILCSTVVNYFLVFQFDKNTSSGICSGSLRHTVAAGGLWANWSNWVTQTVWGAEKRLRMLAANCSILASRLTDDLSLCVTVTIFLESNLWRGWFNL